MSKIIIKELDSQQTNTNHSSQLSRKRSSVNFEQTSQIQIEAVSTTSQQQSALIGEAEKEQRDLAR